MCVCVLVEFDVSNKTERSTMYLHTERARESGLCGDSKEPRAFVGECRMQYRQTSATIVIVLVAFQQAFGRTVIG